MQDNDNNSADRLDEATAARLRRLQSMPVETAHLAEKLREAIPELQPRSRHRMLLMSMWRGAMNHMKAAAAILVVVGALLAIILAGSGGEVVASVNDLAVVHESVVGGQAGGTEVGSIRAAEAQLAKQWPKSPDLPAVPSENVVACSVHEIAKRKMALVTLHVDGQPVTMAVARSSEIKCDMGECVMRGGISYCVHSTRGINMVMVEKDGQWTCFMGKVPVDRLVDLAEQSSKPHSM